MTEMKDFIKLIPGILNFLKFDNIFPCIYAIYGNELSFFEDGHVNNSLMNHARELL